MQFCVTDAIQTSRTRLDTLLRLARQQEAQSGGKTQCRICALGITKVWRVEAEQIPQCRTKTGQWCCSYLDVGGWSDKGSYLDVGGWSDKGSYLDVGGWSDKAPLWGLVPGCTSPWHEWTEHQGAPWQRTFSPRDRGGVRSIHARDL